MSLVSITSLEGLQETIRNTFEKATVFMKPRDTHTQPSTAKHIQYLISVSFHYFLLEFDSLLRYYTMDFVFLFATCFKLSV